MAPRRRRGASATANGNNTGNTGNTAPKVSKRKGKGKKQGKVAATEVEASLERAEELLQPVLATPEEFYTASKQRREVLKIATKVLFDFGQYTAFNSSRLTQP